MYCERLVECADCGDRFKIIYDSKKKHQDRYICKCGKLVCYPDHFGSYSYDTGGNYKEIPYKEQHYKGIYYEEDYIKLTNEENALLSEISQIGTEKLKYYYSEHVDEDGIELALDGCNNSNECLTIKFEVRLKSFGNEWNEREKESVHKRLMDGLSRFKNIMIKVCDNTIDLNDPRKTWENESLEWDDGTRTQHKKYDYELCC